MSISFRCQCGQKLRAREAMAGRQTRCPKCKTQVIVPQPASDQAEVFPAIDPHSSSSGWGSSVSVPDARQPVQPEPQPLPAPSNDLVTSPRYRNSAFR